MTTNGPIQFKKATKKSAKLRLALIGPAGSGKTYTALSVASNLGSRVAVIDTERGSASKYADLFGFDVLELESFHPRLYADAIAAAAAAGYDVVVVDSLSHAWIGKDGGLDLHDNAVDRQKTKNTYTAWRDVTPHHNAMVESIVQAKCHVIATMRSKTEYVQEKDERSGKTTVRKVGLAPVQRDGLEYEFDVVGDLDNDNTLVISKTRCPALSGAALRKPGADLAKTLLGWLAGATPVEPPKQPAPAPPPDAHFVAESAQIRAQMEHLFASATDEATVKAALDGIAKFKDKLTADDIKALRVAGRAALDRVRAGGKSPATTPPQPAATAPTAATAPFDLVNELHQLILTRSKYKTWRSLLATHAIDLPAHFEEPGTDDELLEICDWLSKADALRIRDGFRQAAANSARQNAQPAVGSDESDPEPTDAELAAVEA